MKIMKRYLWLLILLFTAVFLPQRLSAQNNSESAAPGMAPMLPVPGYVILPNGDTLPGKLRWSMKYVENNPVEIKFIAQNGNSKFYIAGEIKGFGNQVQVYMDNDPRPVSLDMEHYVTMPSMKKGVPVFLHRLLDGRITVYQNRSALILSSSEVVTNSKIDGIGFSFSTGQGLSIGPTYSTSYRVIKSRARFSSYLVIKDNGTMVKVDKDDYANHLKDLFSDCPAINDEITKNPDLAKFKSFMLLAEVYNHLCKK